MGLFFGVRRHDSEKARQVEVLEVYKEVERIAVETVVDY